MPIIVTVVLHALVVGVRVVLSLVSIGSAGYRSAEMASIESRLAEFRQELRDIYVDIADAHFQSALQAIEEYKLSRRRSKSQIDNVISHLRDAYNVLDKAMTKEVDDKVFGFIKVGTKPFLGQFQRIESLIMAGQVAQMIEGLLSKIGEKAAAVQWRERQRLQADRVDQYTDDVVVKLRSLFDFRQMPFLSYSYGDRQSAQKACDELNRHENIARRSKDEGLAKFLRGLMTVDCDNVWLRWDKVQSNHGPASYFPELALEDAGRAYLKTIISPKSSVLGRK